MADNLSQKSPKSGEKTKFTNAVNRTTSETMRLGEPEKSVNHPTSLSSSTPNQRKKTPAFQITSVTVGPRISNDGGDDSADDLDESHTDDISDVIDNSRITDIENETPSYSEDTFSKEDVFFNASTTSLGTAPVIPTSSQYGLAIVANEGGGNTLNTAVTCANSISNSDVHVSVTEAGNVINIVSSVKQHETDMRDVHTHTGRNERFKVVKIESTEPFKRGRWMCMDYLDHTMLQQQQSQQAIIVRATDSNETNVGSVHYVGADSGVVITDGLGLHHGMDDHCCTDQSQFNTPAVSTISMHDHHQQSLTAAQQQAVMSNLAAAQNTTANFPSISPGQTLQHISMSGSQSQVGMTASNVVTHQSLQSQQILQHAMVPDPTISQSMGHSIQVVNQQQSTQQNSQGQSHNIATAQVLHQQHHAQSLSQVPIQQNIVSQQQQQVGQHQSLPPQQIQQVMAAASIQQLQHQNMAAGPHQGLSQQQIAHQQGFIQQQTQQMQQQQNLAQQQLSSQQNMISAQHIASQQQPQQQYYAASSVGGVPVSQSGIVSMPQGQSGIQLISQPHSSISAQTQTLQTSTANQQIPVMATSQQSMTSIPVQVTAHSIPVGVSVSNSSSGLPLSVSVSQAQVQQIPAQQVRPINQQQFIPQQHQHIQQQQQMLAQQQIPSQQHLQQQVLQQQIHMQNIQQQQQGIQQQQALQQAMQQQQGMQQSQGIQQPQVMQQPQGMQQQQIISGNVTNLQQTATSLAGMTAMNQGQLQMSMVPPNQQMNQQVLPQLVNQQGQAQLVNQGQPQMVQSIPASSVIVPTIPGSVSNVYSNTMVSAPIQTFSTPVPVTSATVPRTIATSVPQQVTVGNVIGGGGVNVNPVLGKVSVTSVTNVIDPSSGNIVGTVNNPVEVQPSETLNVPLDTLTDVATSGEDLQPVASGGEDAESASGTSAVAIDNKIEQAMDLVKSHLMFAVREEVEVLKEKIAELMDRINQLELENTILKAHASQETLAQLGGNTTQQINKNQQTQQPPNGSIS